MYKDAQTLESNRVESSSEPGLDGIKSRMKATWEDGDYAGFATYMEPGAVQILNAWAIPTNARLLDVGCGSGQTAIPAAKQGMQVTGIDIASNLIEHAQERARYEDLDACFEVGDAENLPYDNNSFDAVISLIGAMFAPNPENVASEFARVCKPGGRLHMANWSPGGFPPLMFQCVAKYTPPPAGIPSPALWGDEQIIQQRLGEHFTDFRLERKFYPLWTYPFDHKALVEFFRQNFGPVKRAFDSLDQQGQSILREELEDIFVAHTVTKDGVTELRGEYLDVSATRK